MAVNGASEKGTEGSRAIHKLMQEASELKESLRLERSRNADMDLNSLARKEPEVSLMTPMMAMKNRKLLKGHRGRVMHFDWSPDKSHVVTAGQDGNAIVWEGFLAQKELLVNTVSPWVLSCSYAPSTTLIACGGMDNQVSIYKTEGRRASTSDGLRKQSKPEKAVALHTKYITRCSFFGSDQQVLTSSADATCALWDVEQGSAVNKFLGHRMEVFGLAIKPRDPYTLFASGSADRTACVWDVRSGVCVMRFAGHESDVNAVHFFPTGEALGTACSDGSIHLFDMRADQEIRFYTKPSILFGASSLDFSRSGRILFGGYDDASIRAWDVLKGTQLKLWLNHTDRVSHIQLSPDGTALGSCSWDGTMRIWA